MRWITSAIVFAAVAVFATPADEPIGRAQTVQVPIFVYDPTFPKPLPETWAIGPIGGLAVDRQDHLFVVQRPGGLLTNERFSGANAKPPKADWGSSCNSSARRVCAAVVPTRGTWEALPI